jgi:hypothetical protein
MVVMSLHVYIICGEISIVINIDVRARHKSNTNSMVHIRVYTYLVVFGVLLRLSFGRKEFFF